MDFIFLGFGVEQVWAQVGLALVLVVTNRMMMRSNSLTATLTSPR